MATVGEVLQQVRARINEPHEARFYNDDLRRWINEGQREVAQRFKWFRKNDSVSAVAGTQTYSLPSDALMLTLVQYTPTGGVPYPLEFRDRRNVTAEQYTWLTSSRGTPEVYWTEGYPGSTTFKLVVFPTPAQNGTFRVDYYAIPPVTDTDDDPVLVPNGYESLIVDFAAYQAMLSDGRQGWEAYKSLYEQNLAAFEEVVTSYVAAPDSIRRDAGNLDWDWDW